MTVTLSLLSQAIASLYGLSIAIYPLVSTVSNADPISIKGECGVLSCHELWYSLQYRWPKVMSALATECPHTKVYGLEMWEADQQKNVSVICWLDTERRGEEPIYGTFFRVFPYPGTEATFRAEKRCNGEVNCDQVWQAIATKYPDELVRAQQECALRQGFLSQRRTEPAQIAVICSFFAPSLQLDDDGDGLMDGEFKPTGVDLLMQSYPWESLGI